MTDQKPAELTAAHEALDQAEYEAAVDARNGIDGHASGCNLQHTNAEPLKCNDYLRSHHPEAKLRAELEHKIVASVVRAVLARGYSIEVTADGESELVQSATRDENKIYDALFACDDAKLFLCASDDADKIGPEWAKTYTGYVYFVYGNSGYDVISDYTLNVQNLRHPNPNFNGKSILEEADRIIERYQ